ncbi:signaling protein [Streptomyces sp. NPDC059556]|uniref:phage baseplate protein n=1 Tax=Streptomyces sp. NPDC059556 TaxID=3346863 RepID=UPI00368CF952
MSLSRRTLLTAIAAAPVLATAGPAQAGVPRAAAGALPVAAPASAGLPPGRLPPGHRFDLKAAPVDLLGKEVLLNHKRAHQQAAFDPVTGLLYVIQLMDGPKLPGEADPARTGAERDAWGDLCVNQLAPDGTVLGVMHLKGFGHGAGLGVEHVDGTAWLWVETDADFVPDDGDKTTRERAHGKRIARLAFAPGTVVDAVKDTFDRFSPVGATAITPSLDVDHGQIAVRHVTSKKAGYRVYDLDAFKRGDFTPKYSFPAMYRTQAWCLYGNLLYQNEGLAYEADNPRPGNSWWNVYDVTTGEVIERTFNATALHLDHRETEAITVRRTPDGPQLVFSFATQKDRLMALYGITGTTDGNDDHVPWTDLDWDKALCTAAGSYIPQYRQSGNRVDLHLRVTRISGDGKWVSGDKILTLPPYLRPKRTQSMVGTTTGAGVTGPLVVRWEVNSDGELRVFDERGIAGWIGLDAGYFTS